MYNNQDKFFAGVMELADVTDSKSVDGDIVWVRVPPPAPSKHEEKDACRETPMNSGFFAFFGKIF